jgi:hypothetical protein
MTCICAECLLRYIQCRWCARLTLSVSSRGPRRPILQIDCRESLPTPRSCYTAYQQACSTLERFSYVIRTRNPSAFSESSKLRCPSNTRLIPENAEMLCCQAALVFVRRRHCGLVVRVLGYRSGGPGSIPGTTRFSEKINSSGVWNGVHSAS